jgi:hypothetical protein
MECLISQTGKVWTGGMVINQLLYFYKQNDHLANIQYKIIQFETKEVEIQICGDITLESQQGIWLIINRIVNDTKSTPIPVRIKTGYADLREAGRRKNLIVRSLASPT